MSRSYDKFEGSEATDTRFSMAKIAMKKIEFRLMKNWSNAAANRMPVVTSIWDAKT